MGFNLEDYEPVQDRIKKFYEKYPDGRIITEVFFNEGKQVIIKSYLFANKDDQAVNCPLSTGLAHEIAGDGYVNKTSHVENAETSAIGRALANIGLHGNLRASREEMEKVQRVSKAHSDQEKIAIMLTDAGYDINDPKLKKWLNEEYKQRKSFIDILSLVSGFLNMGWRFNGTEWAKMEGK